MESNLNTNLNIKAKHIEDFLQDIDDFTFGEKSKFHLQQHLTPPAMASKLIYYILRHEKLQQSVIADLGTGTGMLICGLVYTGALHAIGVEIDEKYCQVTQQILNDKVQGGSFQLIRADIKQLNLRPGSVDLVVMNPPFGTKQAGIDIEFLKKAMKICKGNIYSMHKSSTRNFLIKFALSHKYNMQVIESVKFPLKKRFKGYHKKQVSFTEVDIIKLVPSQSRKEQINKLMQILSISQILFQDQSKQETNKVEEKEKIQQKTQL